MLGQIMPRAYTREEWAILTLEERGHCKVWTGRTDGQGYGRISIQSRLYQVHRLAWMCLYKAELTSEILVCHHCDNPPCWEITHLFLGSHADNAADRNAKGRQARGTSVMQNKLTEQEVLEIRARYAAGGTLQKELAPEYNVDRRTIGDIIRRDTWTHI